MERKDQGELYLGPEGTISQPSEENLWYLELQPGKEGSYLP